MTEPTPPADLRQLVRGFAGALQDLAEQMRERLREWQGSELRESVRRTAEVAVRDVGPALLRLGEQVYEVMRESLPPNWERLTIPQMFDTVELMRESGWSLAWTPPAPVILELLARETVQERGRVLLAAEGRILDDLDGFVRTVARPDLCDLTRAAREALEAHRSGYFWAAQALSTGALTTAIHAYFGHERLTDARDTFEQLDSDEAGIRLFRFYAVLGTVARALERHYPGDADPGRFNRHAATHSVGEPQYGQLNSLTALMLLVSVLLELDAVMQLMDMTGRDAKADSSLAHRAAGHHRAP